MMAIYQCLLLSHNGWDILNNVRNLCELPGFWPPKSPDLNPVNYKIWASMLPEKAQDVNDLRWHLIDV